MLDPRQLADSLTTKAVSTEESGLAALELAFNVATQAAALLQEDLAIKMANSSSEALTAGTNEANANRSPQPQPASSSSAPKLAGSMTGRLHGSSRDTGVGGVGGASSSRPRTSLTGRMHVSPASRRGHHPTKAPLKPSRTVGDEQGAIGGYGEGSLRRMRGSETEDHVKAEAVREVDTDAKANNNEGQSIEEALLKTRGLPRRLSLEEVLEKSASNPNNSIRGNSRFLARESSLAEGLFRQSHSSSGTSTPATTPGMCQLHSVVKSPLTPLT